MRHDELGCDARRGDEAMLGASLEAATPQCAQFVMALRVAAKCGARFVPQGDFLRGIAALGKGLPLPAARFARSSAFGCNAYHSPY